MAVCPNCGKENPQGFRFCGFCTAPLEAASPAPGEERKVISILFVDLVGFTARSHGADPEDVRAALVPYHSLLKREIETFGGTVEKFIGDAVMAVFGAPVAHEDDAERAVRAALRIIDAIADLNERNTLDLSVRAAVNTGEGLIALRARTEAGESMVTGDIVNTASRLQNVAPVDGVVVGEITYRSTKDSIDYEELAPVMVKGKPEPIPVWRALSARSRFGVDANVAFRTPFIGRDYELTTLKLAYARATRESSLQLATIVGEPGVGKSRLLAEFSSFIDEQEELIFWRQGRSLPYGEGITFWALGEVVKAQAGILESDSSEEAASKLRDAISVAVKEPGEHPWFFSRLGPLVGIDVPGDTPQKEESFTAWRRFLEAIAERGPLIVAFEDLHWADPSLLEFIEHLADWVKGVPMFIVCIARPELYDRHPNWGGGKRNITVVSLAPLNDSETAQLISSLLSQAVLPAEVHSTLLERAGGNPLYAEEFVRMLSDRGILIRKGRILTLADGAEIPVPDSVQALIAARLDTLTPERKSLLQDASIAGKVFWSGALAALGGQDDEQIQRGLRELGDKELVRPSRNSSMEGEHEYSFWHALIRDVSYSQIPRAARAEKHRAMAAWIESTAERLDDYAEVLAHHYSTALELARASGALELEDLEAAARRSLVVAGERALKLDPVSALRLYRNALELLDRDDPGTPRMLVGAGMASQAQGLFPNAESYLQEALAGLSQHHDLATEELALDSLAALRRVQGRSEEARALAKRAVELLDQQAPTEALSRAYRSVGAFEWMADSFNEALIWANKAIDAAKACRSRTALSKSLDLRGMVRCDSGDMQGIEDLREAVALADESREPDVQMHTYNNFADVIWLTEGPSEGLRLNKTAQSFAHASGNLFDAFWAKMGSLYMLYELGEWNQVLTNSADSAAWAGSKDATLMMATAKFFDCLVRFHRGDLTDTRPLEQNFVSLLREADDLEELAPCLALTALIHASSGEESLVRSLIDEFETRTGPALHYRARYLPDILRAATAIGDIESSARLLIRESEVPYPHDRHCVLTARAIHAEAIGTSDVALELYTDAAQRWSRYGFVVEHGQALLGAGRCLIACGRQDEARISLQHARNIFATLGARPLLEQTDNHLKQAIALSS
jgi:class 3 adenylate cyclase/tetratricopeptide (TPR) repeat protein